MPKGSISTIESRFIEEERPIRNLEDSYSKNSHFEDKSLSLAEALAYLIAVEFKSLKRTELIPLTSLAILIHDNIQILMNNLHIAGKIH